MSISAVGLHYMIRQAIGGDELSSKALKDFEEENGLGEFWEGVWVSIYHHSDSQRLTVESHGSEEDAWHQHALEVYDQMCHLRHFS
jgi:hypothetical protein